MHKHRTSHLGEAGTKAEADVSSWHCGSEHSERPKAELPQSCCNFLLTILAVNDDHNIDISQKHTFAWKFPSYNMACPPFLT